MKPTMISFLSLLFLELLAVATITVSFSNGSTYVGCIQREREALLRVKQDLNDSSNRLSSWVGDHGDCCIWDAVVCSNFTGHVLELHLGNPFSNFSSDAEYEAYERSMLRGKINPSLLDLKHLVYLDLSYNDFEGAQIPTFLGSMRNLRYLNLTRSQFVGMIPYQLRNLSTLQYLDLSNNYFIYAESLSRVYAESLNWLSGLSSLKHLDLSNVNLTMASDWLLEINKLSSLTLLRLSDCGLQHIPPLPFAIFTSSLTTLDLSFNQFDNLSPDWLLEIYKLTSLTVLRLSGCGLQHIPPLTFANFSSSLTTLDLSGNRFDNLSLISWVFSLHNLEFLDLRSNNFQGPIPDGLQNLTSLRLLDLSENYFNSSIPNWLSRIRSLESLNLRYNSDLQGTIPRSWGRLCNLKSLSLLGITLNQDIYEILDIFSGCILDGLKELYMGDCQLFGQLNDQLGQAKSLEVLDLRNNSISSHVPSSLGELASLQRLDLSFNKLNGTISQIHFANLTRLTYFDASRNLLTLKVNYDWVPPFQLETLLLRSCHLGPQFPSWLHSQQNLVELDISSSGIVDSIPNWFRRSLSQFVYLNLSQNQIQGEIPNLTNVPPLGVQSVFDLSSNNLSGPLPLISPYVQILDLSNNVLSGSIVQFLCHKVNEPRKTNVLKLGENSFSGELSDCWMNWQDLLVLELSDNKFTGNLPFSIGDLSVLQSLHLRNNSLSGAIPTSLKNCTELVVLDIGGNEFFGSVPTWLGERFSKLVILNLRSNKFHGLLPTNFCHLTSLQILDLAYNNFSGSIPSCIHNFSAMVAINYSDGNRVQLGFPTEYPTEDAFVVMKGITAKYNTILNLLRSIDLSENSFSGEIPVEVTTLHAVRSLNLSHNSLTGRIPETIGDMREIESIDLSANQLSGTIPQSMASLTFLNHLNLANNKLTGRIPLGTQLQSLDASSFTGNELCGSPLKNCTVSTVPTPRHEKGEHEVEWFYVSMALGFVVGFWSLIGPLLINRRWRHMYCCFLDRVWNKFVCIVRNCF